MYCSYCGAHSHEYENCPKTWSGSANRAAMRCAYCGATDHNIKACRKTWDGNASMAWDPESVKTDYVKD